MAIPAKIAFEKRYSDDSGVEFGVRYDARKDEIEFEAVSDVQFPSGQLDWLIESLEAIRKIVKQSAGDGV